MGAVSDRKMAQAILKSDREYPRKAGECRGAYIDSQWTVLNRRKRQVIVVADTTNLKFPMTIEKCPVVVTYIYSTLSASGLQEEYARYVSKSNNPWSYEDWYKTFKICS